MVLLQSVLARYRVRLFLILDFWFGPFPQDFDLWNQVHFKSGCLLFYWEHPILPHLSTDTRRIFRQFTVGGHNSTPLLHNDPDDSRLVDTVASGPSYLISQSVRSISSSLVNRMFVTSQRPILHNCEPLFFKLNFEIVSNSFSSFYLGFNLSLTWLYFWSLILWCLFLIYDARSSF